jgi:hypothetical protein
MCVCVCGVRISFCACVDVDDSIEIPWITSGLH